MNLKQEGGFAQSKASIFVNFVCENSCLSVAKAGGIIDNKIVSYFQCASGKNK